MISGAYVACIPQERPVSYGHVFVARQFGIKFSRQALLCSRDSLAS